MVELISYSAETALITFHFRFSSDSSLLIESFCRNFAKKFSPPEKGSKTIFRFLSKNSNRKNEREKKNGTEWSARMGEEGKTVNGKILDGANSKTIERSEVEEKRASEQTSWVNYRGEDGRIKRGR